MNLRRRFAFMLLLLLCQGQLGYAYAQFEIPPQHSKFTHMHISICADNCEQSQAVPCCTGELDCSMGSSCSGGHSTLLPSEAGSVQAIRSVSPFSAVADYAYRYVPVIDHPPRLTVII
ncbi:MAG: hypothetical protein ACPGF7_03770 [Pontibacterium sp.]